MHKSAAVHTNDPDAEKLTIGLKVFVEVPIIMNPRYVLFTGVEGETGTRVIEITAGLGKPLELEPDGFNLDGRIMYRIEEIERGRKFRVHFTNEPEASGTFRGFLNLKTNYDEMPMLNIRINVRISKG